MKTNKLLIVALTVEIGADTSSIEMQILMIPKQLAPQPHRPPENEPMFSRSPFFLAEVSNHGKRVTSHMIDPASYINTRTIDPALEGIHCAKR